MEAEQTIATTALHHRGAELTTGFGESPTAPGDARAESGGRQGGGREGGGRESDEGLPTAQGVAVRTWLEIEEDIVQEQLLHIEALSALDEHQKELLKLHLVGSLLGKVDLKVRSGALGRRTSAERARRPDGIAGAV